MGFRVHPDVQKDRLAALRKAFMDTMKAPAFLADAKKRTAPVAPISSEKLMKISRRRAGCFLGAGEENENRVRLQALSLLPDLPDSQYGRKGVIMLRAAGMPCYRDASPPVICENPKA